jgi:diguanylate cyclase
MNRELEQARDLSAQAMARMEEMRVAPTPENFMVWYHYCGGDNLTLKRSIDILVSNSQELSPEVCIDLYERFFGIGRQAQTLQHVSQRIESAVTETIKMLSSAGAEARHYGEALGNTTASLGGDGGDPEIQRIREIVRRVIAETQAMVDRSDMLEKQLSKSTEEISALRKQVENASREAMTDALTGIGNRKLFDSQLKQFMQSAMEQGTELSMLLLDIDFFKRFNDTYGHQFGDMVLQLVSRTLVDGVKADDVPARYGGEEFAILLPQTELPVATVLADTLRTTIAQKSIIKRDTKENLGNITLSIGVSCYRLGEPPHAFIARADSALYKAKQTGRNRVVTEEDLTAADLGSGKVSAPIVEASIATSD